MNISYPSRVPLPRPRSGPRCRCTTVSGGQPGTINIALTNKQLLASVGGLCTVPAAGVTICWNIARPWHAVEHLGKSQVDLKADLTKRQDEQKADLDGFRADMKAALDKMDSRLERGLEKLGGRLERQQWLSIVGFAAVLYFSRKE